MDYQYPNTNIDQRYYDLEKPAFGSQDFCGTSADLGLYGHGGLNQQTFDMQRSISASTFDSSLDGSYNQQYYSQRRDSRYSNPLSPSPSDGNNSHATYGYGNRSTFYPSSATNTTATYVPDIPRYGSAPQYPQTIETPASPTSFDMVQPEKPKYVCLISGCPVTPFARNADLKRHLDHVHNGMDKLTQYYCDRKNCSRSEKGYQAMLERMSPSTSRTTKDNGIGPFLRKDHYKAHLRDIHKEALWKRSPKEDKNWLDGKIFNKDWWRCPKCLGRVYLKKSGWSCSGQTTSGTCGLTLDSEVVGALKRKMSP